jgi:hypothetical protein
LDEHDLNEVKQGFQRVCMYVRIIELEGLRSNGLPGCIWRLYYELNHNDTELQQRKDIPAPTLPNNEKALKKIFEDITMMAGVLGMKVVRKFTGKNECTAAVEYSSIGCQCARKDFKMATEAPRKWPNITEEIQEVQVTLLQMRM